MKQGLEGLVIKDSKSSYDPNLRHWNKIKVNTNKK
jgi:ATP-dependent DNA ligase